MNKDEIRKHIIKERNALSENFVNEKSDIIINKLCKIIDEKKLENIMIFMDMKNEIQVTKLINIYPNKNFFIPKCFPKGVMKINKYNKNELIKHKFGYYESSSENYIDENILDLIIMPGVAFDENKNRIGFGAGYYDRFLLKFDKNQMPLTIAVCYDFQVINDIPAEAHDQKPDFIITEKRTLY